MLERIRIGHGFDVHQLVEGRDLILGGVKIEHTRGLLGHSDADVVIHALCDATLGALGLGDIGKHFPDTDSSYAGIDSRKLLTHVADKMRSEGYALGNADLTIVAQAPKLAPHIQQMRNNLATDLQTSEQRINIKATTTENLGYVGKEQGMEAHAVVLLQAINDE